MKLVNMAESLAAVTRTHTCNFKGEKNAIFASFNNVKLKPKM